MKLLLVVLLALCAQTQAENLSGLVLGVADGDTISLRDTSQAQHRIRLSGVDAPEKAQPYGLQSRQSLSDLVLGQMVTVQTGKTDRYGRVVGKVLLEGMDVNLEQIRRGLAWHYKAYEREQSVEDRGIYADAESIARDALLGLWSTSATPVPPWEYRHPRSPSP